MSGVELVQAHYVRPLVGDKWPARMAVLRVAHERGEDGRLEFAGAAVVCDAPDDWAEPFAGTYPDPDGLWAAVDLLAPARGELRVWVWDLELELTVSAARRHLSALGWWPDGFSIRDRGGWWIWRRDRARLVICDACGYLGGASLDQLRQAAGLVAEAELSDALCVRQGLRDTWAWLAHEDGGSLALSGASQGMTLYRRRFLPERTLLAHASEELRAVERRATWAGRLEAWRYGQVAEPLEEWDYELCYPHLARQYPLPVRPLREVDELPRWTSSALPGGRRFAEDVLATVRVTTEAPLVPCEVGERGICYPVGSFTTTLWGPELRLLLAGGAQVELAAAATVYRLEPVLADWGQWICQTALFHPDPLIRRVAKMWGRTVIGSFGLRYQEWIPFSDDPGVLGSDEITRVPYSGGDQRYGELLYLAGQTYELGELREAANSIPSLQGYVWSLARCHLWAAMRHAGVDQVVYVDTDSLVTTAEGAARLRSARLPGLRVKSRYPEGFTVYGIRQLVFPSGEVRAAGLKRGARQVAPEVWEADILEGFTSPLSTGESARVVPRIFQFSDGELHRDRLAGGYTGAIRV